MQKLIASYLFQNRKCMLPFPGTLEIINEEAVYNAGEQTISAPVPVIHFSHHIGDPADLENFIAANKAVTKEEASYQLHKFCDEIKSLNKGEEIIIPGAGKFYKDGDKIEFLAEKLPPVFTHAVKAERVVHPDRSHHMIVGDKETNTAVMTEYFAEGEIKKRKKWWIAALILFLISVAAVVLYMNTDGHNSQFGISHKYEIKDADSTYRKIP